MASSSSSPRKRSIASPKLYDAFISHRGPDVKHTLAKQLYEILQERGCRAFLDREEIEGGDSIPSAIESAICSSVVQIAIFSKGYAQSSWCLDELVLMLQQTDALFIPVFYDVQPWELRHIENEKSQYAAAFSDYQHKGRNLDKLDKWKSSLESASNISGYELSQHQDNLCEKIVSRVLQEMKKRIPLHVAEYPIRLAELVEDFERSCSRTARDKVTIVGIFGLGGAGKTTLAKKLFNVKNCSGYHASCFLSDVRESKARGKLHCLQSQLFEDLFKEKQVFRNVDDGIARLKHRLGRARHLHFLVVLDDIDHRDQLDALLPEAMLSPGSLVIITTRDQGVLRCDIRYKMKEMESHHAKELFCSHAFGKRDPPTAYEKLVESFVEFCGGLPLSLKVLGAHLYGRNEDYWKLELEKVKQIQPKDIMQSLKISFDGLDSQEKQIFIDIACFFNTMTSGLHENAISIWEACGWSAEHAVQTLKDKCLIEDKRLIEYNWRPGLRMHDHLRDLGRQMADELGPPRLWRPEILRSMEAKGLKQILAQTKVRCFHYYFKDSSLKAYISCFIGSLNDSIETELLWLEISGYEGSLESIPSWIPLRKLYHLSVSHMEDLRTFQQQMQTNPQASFELRSLFIENCPSLQMLPDSIGIFSHLEALHICGSFEKPDVTSFVQSLKVQSLKQLSNLRSLVLRNVLFSGDLNLSQGGDSNNFEASTSSRMNSLETIYLSRLDNISKLVISGDMCPGLRSLSVWQMEDLDEMDLKELERLNNLEVCRCDKLETISGLSSLTGLESLKLGYCSILKMVISESSPLTRLQSLYVRNCPKLETVSLSSLPGLQMFETWECEGLKSLPTFAHQRHLERIKISNCEQLQNVEGIEALPGLRSLVIEVPDSINQYGWVRKCICGLKRLPSEYTVLVGKAVDKASSKLNVELFSEVISIQTDVEIMTVTEGLSGRDIRKSSSAITIYAFLLDYRPNIYVDRKQVIRAGPISSPSGCEWMMITILQTPHVSEGTLERFKMKKGIKARVNEGEEEKALALLQIIVDQLYRGITVPKLLAYDVVKRKRKQEH